MLFLIFLHLLGTELLLVRCSLQTVKQSCIVLMSKMLFNLSDYVVQIETKKWTTLIAFLL
jgi:hypothetical protein